jgi:hypothetical protein
MIQVSESCFWGRSLFTNSAYFANFICREATSSAAMVLAAHVSIPLCVVFVTWSHTF